MAWCNTSVSDFFGWNFVSLQSAWIFACGFQLSSKTLPDFFFGWFAFYFWEKRGENIEACTMNATRRNKRKPLCKFSSLQLVRAPVAQSIKARVLGENLKRIESRFKSRIFPPFFFNLFSFFAFFPLFFCLLKKAYLSIKPPNIASQIRWFNAGFDLDQFCLPSEKSWNKENQWILTGF